MSGVGPRGSDPMHHSGSIGAGYDILAAKSDAAALSAGYNVVPVRQIHRDVSVDALDPDGVSELSGQFVAEAEKEKSGITDPEKGAELTYDPFATAGKFDFRAYMQKIVAEDQSRSHAPREMGLVFRDLNVTGYGTGAKFHQNVGSLFLEPFRKLANIRNIVHRPVKHILHDVTGCVKPGEMLLVLGRPGAGCTTFLKSLASYRDGFRSIEGTVIYQGFDHHVIDGPLRGDVVYAPEDDKHFATLSVNRTLGFAAAARAPNS